MGKVAINREVSDGGSWTDQIERAALLVAASRPDIEITGGFVADNGPADILKLTVTTTTKVVAG